MGFALWVEGETAWCAGTHEYRPMGVAVIASSSLFAARDFHTARKAPGELIGRHFQGLFASLPDVNRYLRRQRRSIPDRQSLQRQLAIIHTSEK